MKRPFAVFCAVIAALSALRYAAGHPDRDGPLRETAALLCREAEDAGGLSFTGIVAKCSAASSGVRLSVDHLTIQRKDNSEQSLIPDLNVLITTEHTELLPGDELAISGKAVFWESDTNPGQFDAQGYYDSQNSICMISDAQIITVRPGRMSLARALCIVRRRLCRSFEAVFEEQQAHTMEAICLGERGLLTSEWKEFYQEGGIAHILAISGLHISLIGMCLYRLLRRAGAPFGVCCAVSGTVVVLYVLMSGAGVSAVRAMIMFAFWLGAQLLGRKYDILTAIAAAAMLLLMADPGNLSQSSFLLSFSAVLAIALLPGFAMWLGTLPVVLYFFYQAVPWSILINLAVVPLMTALMACGLIAGMLGLVFVPLGIFCAAPAHYLLGLFEFLCRLKEGLPASVWVAGRPAWWRIALYYGILLAAGFISYRLKDAGTRKAKVSDTRIRRVKRRGRGEDRRRRGEDRNDSKYSKKRTVVRCALWICCGAVCIGLMIAPSPDRLEITCLDVGQGDASLLRLPDGTACLVDGGSTSESKVWKYRIGQAVKYYGVRTLDYIFLSHADADHIGGVEEYLQEYEPGFAGENVHGITLKNLVLPPTAEPDDFERLRELAQEKGIRVLQMEAGAAIGSRAVREDAVNRITFSDAYADANRTTSFDALVDANRTTSSDAYVDANQTEGEWSIICLAPDAAALTGERNEDSMVLLLQYGKFRMLFTGDLEGAAERRLAASKTELSADVLKVGHHGSKNASSEEFLARVSPQFAVISCGEDNSYGHPAAETVERLKNAGSRILQTPQSGAVMIESDGETYTVRAYSE